MHATLYTGLLCALAAPSLGAVWESLPAGVPSTWSYVSTPSGDESIGLFIALSCKNLDQLESVLREVSTPGKAQYGQWLDKDEIGSKFPVVDDTLVVNCFEKVNKLLDTSFSHYQNGDSVKLRTVQCSIPDDLANHIDLISPTVHFGKIRKALPRVSKTKQTRKASNTEVSASCQTSITPQCLKELYNVGKYTPKVESGSWIWFALSNIPSHKFTVVPLFGAVDNQTAAEADVTEANLDVQNIIGVSHPLPVTEYIGGGLGPLIPDADSPTQADDQNEPYLPYYSWLRRTRKRKVRNW